MTNPTKLSCDVFCRVIDNFGDAGVAWRLSRSLQREEGFCVRLVIDNLETLRKIVPEVSLEKKEQCVEDVTITLWDKDFEKRAEPAHAVIEAFSCFLPESYEEKIHKRFESGHTVSLIALDYLTAEPYAKEFHGLPSPHPKYGYPKRFYFPGFEASTGGLFIEGDFEKREALFGKEERETYAKKLGISLATPLKIFLFTYPAVDTRGLARELAKTGLEIEILLAPGAAGVAFLEEVKKIGASQIHTVALPMVPIREFDQLLSLADFLIVRGEDSASRAILSGKPFLWTLYAQKENAHLEKMRAFEKTLEPYYPEDLLLLRNRIELALNEGKSPSGLDLKRYLSEIERLKKVAICYTSHALKLPRAPREIAKMLRDGLK